MVQKLRTLAPAALSNCLLRLIEKSIVIIDTQEPHLRMPLSYILAEIDVAAPEFNHPCRRKVINQLLQNAEREGIPRLPEPGGYTLINPVQIVSPDFTSDHSLEILKKWLVGRKDLKCRGY